MARKQDLLKDILLCLYDQGPNDRTRLSKLCEAVGVSSQEPVIEALDQLEAQGFVERSGLDRHAVLCWITYTGRQVVKEFAGHEAVESASEIEVHPPYHVDELETEVIEEYPEFSWNPDRLTPQLVPIVQRQDVIERIKRILEGPGSKRIAFLYGLPQVGKTFVLRRLKEMLRDQYVTVFINVNGWSSRPALSDFLHELARSIQFDIESSRSGLQVTPFKKVSERQATAEFARFMYDLAQSINAEGKPFLLMFDDLEYLARQETDRRIFEYLTGFVDTCAQQARQARFVFAGSGEMLDLLRHRAALATLWARGEPVRVECFTKETSRDLAIASTDRYFELEPRALDRIVCLADGHPSLLKDLLTIIVRRWRNKWRKRVITEEDLSTVLEDIYTELCPKLIDIWRRLPVPERHILQQVAEDNKESFSLDEIVFKPKRYLKRHLRELVNCQILDYVSQDERYTVRLGLLIDSISYGSLSP